MTFSTAKNRWPMFIAAIAALVLMAGLVSQSKDRLPQSAQRYWPFNAGKQKQEPEGAFDSNVAVLPPIQLDGSSFYSIALKHGTDKVTDHSYQDMVCQTQIVLWPQDYLADADRARATVREVSATSAVQHLESLGNWPWL